MISGVQISDGPTRYANDQPIKQSTHSKQLRLDIIDPTIRMN